MMSRLLRRAGRPAAGRSAAAEWAVVAAALLVLQTIGAAPGYAAGPPTLPARAASDLGTVRADGVTLTDSLASFGQANAYTFRVVDGPGAVQVYVGDLWYDVEVLLLRASALPDDPGQWRSLACGADCLSSAPPSARRRIQFVQPKGLIEPVQNGSYAIVVRPRDEADFSDWRQFTVRVTVSPPLCTVNDDAASGYRLALAMTPASPGRADLVTLTAYVSPPFADLFDFAWTVDGRAIGSNGPVAQGSVLELTGGRPGGHQVQVVARGARPYPDPAQPETPPSLSTGCTLTAG